MHLKPGDPVTIIREANNSLTILPNARSPISNDEVITLILHDENGNSLKRKVVSMYLAGYNIMHLKSKSGRISPPQRDAVREVVRRNLVGTEIIADASDLITIQVLLNLPELPINTASKDVRSWKSSCYALPLVASSICNHSSRVYTKMNQF